MIDEETAAAIERSQSQKMFLVATDYHTGLGHPWDSWVGDWLVEDILSKTPCSEMGMLEAVALAFYRLTKTGEQSNWYIKAGPVTRAELEEWHATGYRNGEPFPRHPGADLDPEAV